MAVKRAMISDYNGKSLNSNDDCQILVDPPHPRTKELKEWYTHLQNPNDLEHVQNNNDMTRDLALFA